MTNEAPRTTTLQVNLPASTILATTTIDLGEVVEDGVVASAEYIPTANITGAASPASRDISIINKGQDGNGTTVVAVIHFLSGTNGLDFDALPFTLSVVAGATTVAEGDVLAITSAPVGGTGLVDPGGEVKVEINRA
jgi:hypothetical protein